MLWARTLTVAALVALPLLAAGFGLRLGLPWRAAWLGALLLGALPLISLAQVPLLARLELKPKEIYRSSALSMAGLSVLALLASAPDVSRLGLVPLDLAVDVPRAGALALLVGLLTVLFMPVDRWVGQPASDLTRLVIPQTTSERFAFVGVTVVAALGEEIVFRGYLVSMLAPSFGGVWPALGISSLAFGLLHAYQGPVGIVRTALLGALLGAGWLVWGSLWPAIAAHFALNLFGGLWLGPRLYRETPDPDQNPDPYQG